jgi:hypothetical protein
MRQRNGPRQGAMRLEGLTRRRANVLDRGLAVVTVPVAFGPVLACRYGPLDIALRLGTATLVGVVLGLIAIFTVR